MPAAEGGFGAFWNPHYYFAYDTNTSIHTVGKRKYKGHLQSTAVRDIDHACVSYATKDDDLKTMLSKREVREEAQRILRLMWIAQSFNLPIDSSKCHSTIYDLPHL